MKHALLLATAAMVLTAVVAGCGDNAGKSNEVKPLIPAGAEGANGPGAAGGNSPGSKSPR